MENKLKRNRKEIGSLFRERITEAVVGVDGIFYVVEIEVGRRGKQSFGGRLQRSW